MASNITLFDEDPMQDPNVQDPNMQGPNVLEFDIDDVGVRYVFSVITEVTDKMVLIETEFLIKLMKWCTAAERQKPTPGIVIRGPSGTGKTFSCVYLWKKLKERGIPFLVCSPQCFMQDKSLYISPCIQSFLEDNGISSFSDDYFKNSSLEEIYVKIFGIQELQSKNPIFFADLFGLTTNDLNVAGVVRLLMCALSNRWFIVVAYTSGGGWMLNKETLQSSAVRRNLSSLQSKCDILKSTLFTDKEAKKFTEIFEVDRKRIDDCHIEVVNNPYFFHCFRNTMSNPDRFDVSRMSYNERIKLLTKRFLSTLSDRAYSSEFNDCLTLLEYARHHTSLNDVLIDKYKCSYLHLEYLAVLEENEDNGESHTTLNLIYPPMYRIIVDQLKECYSQKKNDICSLPIVRGYIFEKCFLHCADLHILDIVALGTEDTIPKKFLFSSVTTAAVQETDPIESMIENEIHHLRPDHPAIDGVCVTTESTSHRRYLLLLQVSLTEYRRHESKGIDIRKRVEPAFEGKISKGVSTTIAQYYKKLAKVKSDENVIYVYISPNELDPPSSSTFSQEMKVHNTTSDSHNCPKYLYGFCSKNMKERIVNCVPS